MFYGTYLSIASDDSPPDIDLEALKLLKDRNFAKYIIEHEDPTISIKMLSHVMKHSMLKPQRLLIDNEDYYIAIDMLTNTYYICYRDLMMIDIDRYKSDSGTDTLSDIKEKLSKHPELFFRIYSSRNGYHIFILNKSMDYKSDESIRLMHELGCDFYYIVYSYMRGWSVRLNKKKGEENTDVLYIWVGDVVRGQFFNLESLEGERISKESLGIVSEKVEERTLTSISEDIIQERMLSILPDERLDGLVALHINLVNVFKDTGLCSMPAPK